MERNIVLLQNPALAAGYFILLFDILDDNLTHPEYYNQNVVRFGNGIHHFKNGHV